MAAPPSFGRAEPDGELRLATVVRCDMVDSTRQMGGLDPSDRLSLTLALKAIVHGIVERSGGRVERWDGDGGTLLFGYPASREDGPQVAVRVALELVSTVRSLEVAGCRIDFRVGVASGRIAVDLATGLLDGHVFNVAERLRAAGEPGWVVIADATKELTNRFFDYADLGVVVAKGFDQGLRAWRVTGETAISSRYAARHADAAPTTFVGRDAEMTLLANAWAEAAGGSGSVALLIGEAGMGKSRLARELIAYASQRGGQCLEVDCMPSARNTPLFPVGLLLRRAAGITTANSDEDREILARRLLDRLLDRAEAERAIGFLAPLFGFKGVALVVGPTPEAVQEQTISTVVRMLRAAAEPGPLAVICEDVHWADDTSARVIERLAAEIGRVPILLVITTRPESDVPVAAERLGEKCRRISLKPLGGQSAAALVGAVAGETRLSRELVGEIVDRCEGIPLILEEVTRSALDGHVPDDRVQTMGAVGAQVPAALQLVIEGRLERWRRYKFIIQAASVLGRDFSLRVLGSLHVSPEGDVADAVSLLADNGWFVRRSTAGDRVRFSHAMIRDGVYQTLLRDDRRNLHSRVADVLAVSADPSPEAVAQHLCEAARFAEAIHVRLDASADTVARGSYVEAEGHCRAGLAMVDNVTPESDRAELRFRLLLQLGVTLAGRHGYSSPRVEAVYREARAASGEVGDTEMLYPVMRGLAALANVRGNYAECYALSTECIDLAEESGRPEYIIDALSIHCYAAFHRSRFVEGREAVRRCLELYEKHDGDTLTYPVPNDPRTAALSIAAEIEWTLGDAVAAESFLSEAARNAEQIGNAFDKAYVQIYTASLRIVQRRFAEAAEAAKLVNRIGEQHQQQHWILMGRAMDLLTEVCMGPAPDAMGSALETGKQLAAEGVGTNVAWNLWGLARGFSQLGQADMAAKMIERALAYSAVHDERRVVAELLMAKAELTGNPAEAKALVERALAESDEIGDVSNALRAAARLRLAAADADDEETELAARTTDALEGRAGYPSEPRWMIERLARLRPRATATAAIDVMA